MWRWLLTALALTMIGLAIYWLYINSVPPPKTLFISVTADREELATVPPIPMLDGDEQAIRDWARATTVPIHFAKLPALRPVEDFCRRLASEEEQPRYESIGEDGQTRDSGKRLRKHDTLVLYIRAHGMAMIDGKDLTVPPTPFLVSSFQGLANVSHSNSLSVADLLQNLSLMPEVKKLVILDAVHFNYDPRLGQLVNQFPSAVANAYPVTARNLWVVMPGENGETSVIAPQQGRTLFNLALFDSLRSVDNQSDRLPLPNILESLRDRVAEARSDESDLSFWQSLQRLPTESMGNQTDPAGAAIVLPLIPATVQAEPSEETEKGDAKKTARNSPAFPNALPISPLSQLSLVLQQAGDAVPAPASAAEATKATPDSTQSPPAPAAPVPPASLPSATPGAGPGPAPAVASPDSSVASADQPPPHDPFVTQFSDQLAAAWQLRDELESWESSFGRQGWSPIHFAPHHWRRLNALLISYEERCRAGAANNNRQLLLDLQQLIDGMRYLKRLLQQEVEPSNQGTGVIQDLSDAWYRLKSNGSLGPSKSWMSFQASEKNSLHDANRALKLYADCAYRLPEYVRLQGIMLSAADVNLTIGTDLELFEQRLRETRSAFERQSENNQMRPNLARDLMALATEVQRSRQAVDAKISGFAQQLTVNRSVALPGRAQAICLLLESPVVAAADRATLLNRVLPLQSPPAVPPATLRSVASSGTGELQWDHLFDQANAELRVLKLLSMQDRSANVPEESLVGSAKWCIGRVSGLVGSGSRPQTAAVALGYEFREFYSQLPPRLMDRNRVLVNSAQGISRRQLFDLYHWLLLVDGRDAGRLKTFPVYLTQPFLPEPMPDQVKLTLSPNPLQLTGKEQPVQVTVDLMTDRTDVESLGVQLFLEPQAPGMEIIDPQRPAAPTTMSDVHVGSSKRWTHTFHVKAQPAAEGLPVKLRARVKFFEATASQEITCHLPRPNIVDLKVVPSYRYDESKPNYGADESLAQGSVLRLNPNRDSSFKLLLQNKSSDDKKVRVQIIRVPRQAFQPDPNRQEPWSPYLFGEGRALISELQPLDNQLAGMQGLPPQLAEQVLATSPEKTPLVLPSAGSPLVPVTLEMKSAPADPANPAAGSVPLDATTGLLCVITNVDKPSERFIKWLDLVPYAPHELFAIPERDISFVNGVLSFKVVLFAAEAAAGMRLDQPLKVVWDRTGTRLGNPPLLEATINPQTLTATFKAEIPPETRQDVILRLNIDGYPRALIHGLQLDDKIQVVSNKNLKRDPLSGLHLGRLTHDKTMFLIQSSDAVYTPSSPPETVPPDLKIKTLRREDRSLAGIRLDNPSSRQRMTADLQADVHPSFFSSGGWIELGYDGEEPKFRFLQDRDIRIQLTSISPERGLTLHTTIQDFTDLDVSTEAAPPDDTRKRLSAALRGDADLSSDSAVHAQAIVFDRKTPRIVNAELQNDRIVVNARRELTRPIVVDVQATDGNGIGLQSVNVSLLAKPRVAAGEVKSILLESISQPEENSRVTRTVPTGLPDGVHEFDVQVVVRDQVDRVTDTIVLPLTIEVPKRKDLKLGPLFDKEAKVITDSAKEQKKLDDEIKKLKTMQGPSGS
jgi:hypothetical protein